MNSDATPAMWLRQIALVAKERDPVRHEIFEILGLKSDFEDEGVSAFGLHNSVMAIGNNFLEIVAPVQEVTSAGRLLERMGGDGGYMILVQTDDIDFYRTHTEGLGVRKIWEADRDDVKAFHMHPKDLGATIVSIDWMAPEDEWEWAGKGWQTRRSNNVNGITAVDVQCHDQLTTARRWADVLNQPVMLEGNVHVMRLRDGKVNFVEALDDRGEGVCGIEFSVTDWDAIRSKAKMLGLTWHGNELVVAGTKFRFVDS
jgi:hypothetical protein